MAQPAYWLTPASATASGKRLCHSRVWISLSRLCVCVTAVAVFAALAAATPGLTARRVQAPTLAASASTHAQADWRGTVTSPQYDALCGEGWQRDYAALHGRVLAGQAPPKYAVALGADVGLADRLVGTMSVFFYALLSGRAFQIASYPGVVSLREAFEPAHINWDRPDMDEGVIANIKADYNGTRYGSPRARPIPADLDTSQYWPVYALGGRAMADLLRGDVRKNPAGHANTTIVVIASNRGHVWDLFDNPVHKNRLLEAGLRPDTAVACAFRYLFRSRPEVRNMFQATWDALSEPATLKIGIQIRVGDDVFKPNNASSQSALAWTAIAPYFACAAEIERTRAQPGQAVLYYLMSDSLAVRRLAKRRVGDKLITDTDTPPAHVGCFDGGTCTHDRQVQALRQAVGELVAYSKADYHVYHKASGFGRVGAWLSLAWHHHYMVPGNPGVCGGVDDYMDLRVDARERAGV